MEAGERKKKKENLQGASGVVGSSYFPIRMLPNPKNIGRSIVHVG